MGFRGSSMITLEDNKDEVMSLYYNQVKINTIAKKFNCCRNTIYNWMYKDATIYLDRKYNKFGENN